MRITRISAYALPFRFVGGGFKTSYGPRTHLDNLLISLATEEGATGYGEMCRMTGASPKPSDPVIVGSVAATLSTLLGMDPTRLGDVHRAVGELPPELQNLRCALDTAGHDILSWRAGLPLHALLGGRSEAAMPVYASIGQDTPKVMAELAAAERAKGCRCFQVKVGGNDPEEDAARIDPLLADLREGDLLLADANGAWSVAEAVAMMGRFHHPGLRWEEPCKTYEDNRQAADRSGAPLILDQCLSGLATYARLCADGFAAGAGLKPTVLDGLSAARVARDLCAASRIPMKIDDSWGADVASAAVVHLAAGMPEDLLLATLDMRIYFHERAGEGGPLAEGYSVRPTSTPGLGIVPDLVRLGPRLIDLRS